TLRYARPLRGLARPLSRWSTGSNRRPSCPTRSGRSRTCSATTRLSTLSLHDALPIFVTVAVLTLVTASLFAAGQAAGAASLKNRSEEHTSELQSRGQLICRLLPEKNE